MTNTGGAIRARRVWWALLWLVGFGLVIGALVARMAGAAETVTGTSNVTVTSVLTESGGLSVPRDAVSLTHSLTWAAGTATTTPQADLVYRGARDLGAGTAENLDLYGGLTSTFGTTLNFARVRAIYLRNASGSQPLTIGSDTAAPWAPGIVPATAAVSLPASGALFLVAPLEGWPVTNGSADLLTVTNGGTGTATYHVWIIGSSQ